jgi:hypothetical protein
MKKLRKHLLIMGLISLAFLIFETQMVVKYTFLNHLKYDSLNEQFVKSFPVGQLLFFVIINAIIIVGPSMALGGLPTFVKYRKTKLIWPNFFLIIWLLFPFGLAFSILFTNRYL